MCVQRNRKANTQAIILTVVIEIVKDCSTLQVLAGSHARDRMGVIFKMVTVQETDTVIATFSNSENSTIIIACTSLLERNRKAYAGCYFCRAHMLGVRHGILSVRLSFCLLHLCSVSELNGYVRLATSAI